MFIILEVHPERLERATVAALHGVRRFFEHEANLVEGEVVGVVKQQHFFELRLKGVECVRNDADTT